MNKKNKKIKTKLLTLVTLAFIGLSTANAQVGIGTEEPDASAQLEVQATDKGFLPPRTTPGEIINPAEGLVIYNNSSQCLEVFNGTAWVSLCDGTLTDPLTTVIGANGLEWMDRNLGANQVATSSTDADAYGDLYQWGRAADGHEKIFRITGDVPTSDMYTDAEDSNGVANFNSPGGAWDGLFITRDSGANNWVDPSVSGVDDLWQGVNGTNNPCPAGFRVPTEAEWQAEIDNGSWSNASHAYNSDLALPVAGYRYQGSGGLLEVGSGGVYWSSSVSGTVARYLYFDSSEASMNAFNRANGFSVRCLKD